MKQILFILIFLFAFTVQIEVKNKTLETVKFRNIKYDPRNIFRTNSIEICGPGKIYLCDSKNSCSCVLRNNIKYITTKTTKQLNVSSKINEIIKPKTTRFFTHSFIKKVNSLFIVIVIVIVNQKSQNVKKDILISVQNCLECFLLIRR